MQQGSMIPPRPIMKRQYSIKSEEALNKLSACEMRLKAFEEKFREYIYAANSDQDVSTLVTMKNDLAMMVGEVDKLQMIDIDGVNTQELRSGKDDAKFNRKYLNVRTETLSSRVAELHQSIKQFLQDKV